jgi:hypothetical protein
MCDAVSPFPERHEGKNQSPKQEPQNERGATHRAVPVLHILAHTHRIVTPLPVVTLQHLSVFVHIEQGLGRVSVLLPSLALQSSAEHHVDLVPGRSVSYAAMPEGLTEDKLGILWDYIALCYAMSTWSK